jgi:hypothetical protein
MAQGHPAPIGISKIEGVVRFVFDRNAGVTEAPSPGLQRRSIHLEGDELLRIARTELFVGRGLLEHEENVSGAKPKGVRPRTRFHGDAKEFAVETLEGFKLTRSEGQVVNTHALSLSLVFDSRK